MIEPPQLVFIGSPTQDLVIRHGMARHAAGGAAFISALAARWTGARVGVVARVPVQLPIGCAETFGPGGLDRGGLRTMNGALPGFRITYDENDNAQYNAWSVGLEGGLSGSDIPDEWKSAWVHIAGIGASAAQQRRVLSALPKDQICGLSIGTCKAMIEESREDTLALLRASDVFFLNEEEWSLLCPNGIPDGHAGTVVVTRGQNGVSVISTNGTEHTPAIPTEVIDPTGAGDAFCGGYLGALVGGSKQPPVDAGLRAASIVLGGLGSETLAQWVAAQVTPRADHNDAALDSLAPLITEHAQTSAFDFTQEPHLERDHPMALPMLWVSTMHQYGFWTADAEHGWEGPMIAPIDGVLRKGSDFIWAAFARAARNDPSSFSPERMANEPNLFAQICTDDNGTCPVPDLASHTALHVAHGKSMLRDWPKGYTQILERVSRAPKPIAALLAVLRGQPGYMSDPLAKKANLLAVVLSARPEHWLAASDPESIQPIVDYHMMRLCMRTGLVQILDPDLHRRLRTRMWVDMQEELAIRQATGRAILGLVQRTNQSVAAIDGLFFRLGRTACLETQAPDCHSCPIQSGCAQETELFQPVYRTTAY